MAQRRQISLARTAGLLAVTAVWAILLGASGSPEVILFTVPVFLLAAPLAIGRYIGESLIEGFRGSSRRRFATPARVIPARTQSDAGSRLSWDRTFGRAPPAPAG